MDWLAWEMPKTGLKVKNIDVMKGKIGYIACFLSGALVGGFIVGATLIFGGCASENPPSDQVGVETNRAGKVINKADVEWFKTNNKYIWDDWKIK